MARASRAAPRKPAPKVAAQMPAPKPAAQAPAAVGSISPTSAAAPAPRRAGVVVQVAAVASEAEAKGLLAALAASLGDHETWVETAVVGGRTWRRAVVGGVADRGEAERLCGKLKAAGRTCFVRVAGPG
jgi:cell division septation protein DedD